MTRLRAVLVANVLLAILAFALIATDWRQEDASAKFGELTIVRPAKRYALVPYLNAPQARAQPVTPVQRPKPPIAGPDLMTGKQLALSQFHGKPVFVSVWASWNVGSLDQASTVARFAQSHESEVAFLGVNSEDSKSAAREFAKRFHMDFPSISDPIGIIAAGWSPVPTTLVFDRRHKLVQRIDGSASRAQLDAALRRVTRR